MCFYDNHSLSLTHSLKDIHKSTIYSIVLQKIITHLVPYTTFWVEVFDHPINALSTQEYMFNWDVHRDVSQCTSLIYEHICVGLQDYFGFYDNILDFEINIASFQVILCHNAWRVRIIVLKESMQR